jgi:hypothetical protein
MTLPGGPDWSGLEIPSRILEGGLRAPVAFPRQAPRAYRTFIERLLGESGVPGGALQAAVATGSGLFEGAADLVEWSNRLIDPAASGLEGARAAARGLLLASGALLGHRNAAYVLQQVGEIVRSRHGPAAPEAALPRVPRRKGLIDPLEAAFERLGLSRHMEPERSGPLLVHLDEIYDDAAVQIERALHIASREIGEARTLAPEFLTRLHRDFARASFADHLLAEHEKEKGPGEGTGLLDLLRELGEALERA